ncbi:MAG: DUF881 domain-containing protein [Actinomycetota bacterium]
MTDHDSPRPEHPPDHHGRHELPPAEHTSALGRLRRGPRSGVFGVLAVLLCLVLGIAIATQVRQTGSGDALDTARPADLLVLLDSLQQREAALNSEVTDLQRTLADLQASGNSDQAAIENARARLAALSILIGTVPATGPGVTLTIADPSSGVAAETMLDVINELRAAGAEAMQIGGTRDSGDDGDDGQAAVRVGVDTWVVGPPGALVVDSTTLKPAYSVVAIGDPPTLAAAMNIPGGAMDSIERVGGTMVIQQSDRVDVTALRQPKPRQYAQPVK